MSAPAAPGVAKELARSRSYLALLSGLMEEFSQAKSIDSAWAASALERIAAAMNAQAASLFLLEGRLGDPDARLVCQASVGAASIAGLEIATDAGIAGRALQSNTAQLVADVRKDPDFVSLGGQQTDFEVRSLLCAPLTAMGEAIGVVELLNHRGGGRFSEQDRETLSALASAAALAVINARLAQERVEQERLQRELELAGAVQRGLLPRELPADSAVHGLNRPARGVSGDFYDILTLPDGRTVFALADVSGKGMNAALIMVKAATLFRSWARRVNDPGRLLARIESELCETMSLGMFVTMVVGLYDPRKGQVRLSNAGHEPPLLRTTDGRYLDFPATDPPLGVQCRLQNNRYRETLIELGSGSLYLCTDGATEGRLADGQPAGIEGVKRLIEAHARRPAAQRLEPIADAYGEDLRDDLTLLVVEDPRCIRTARRPARRRSPLELVSQSLPAQADQLRIVRRLVEAAAHQAGAGRDWAGDLALAVDEACQNIIRHGYKGIADGRIELRIRQHGEELSVELSDSAPIVTEARCQSRPLDQLRPGGLGTYLMRSLTDRVRFLARPGGTGNRTVLIKRLGTSAPAKPAS